MKRLVVGDDDQGGSPLALEPAEQAVDLVAGRGVELPGRLIGQDQDRVLDQGPGDGDALLLAARELVRPVVQAVASPTSPRSSTAFRLRAGVVPRGRNGTSTFSTAVRLAIRLNAWKMKPTRSRR